MLSRAKLAAGATFRKLVAWWDGDFRPVSAVVLPSDPSFEAAFRRALTLAVSPTPISELVPGSASGNRVATSVFVRYRAAGNEYVLPFLLPRDSDLTLPPTPMVVLSTGGLPLPPAVDGLGSRRRVLRAELVSDMGRLDVTSTVLAFAGPDGDFHEGVGALPYVGQLAQYLGWSAITLWSLVVHDDWGCEWVFRPSDLLRLPIAGPVLVPLPPVPQPMFVPPVVFIPPPPDPFAGLPHPRGITLCFPKPTLGPDPAPQRRRKSRTATPPKRK